MISIRPYEKKDFSLWNLLIEKSRNGNFLHNRKYMDYHQDRFNEASIVVERLGKPIAVLPANIIDNVVISHSGLTYAGLISTIDLGAEDTLNVFEKIREHYLRLKIDSLIYRAIPYIFHRLPCQEDLYALHLLGAKLVRRDLSSATNLRKLFKFQGKRERSILKARKLSIAVRYSENYEIFHDLLSEVLKKFDTVPTHTLKELNFLHSQFPSCIKLYESILDDVVLAGALIYDFGDVVHTQYLASSTDGKKCGALDFLLSNLINQIYCDRKYFSFGISTAGNGQALNLGLISQKEGFGAHGVTHDIYEWIF